MSGRPEQHMEARQALHPALPSPAMHHLTCCGGSPGSCCAAHMAEAIWRAASDTSTGPLPWLLMPSDSPSSPDPDALSLLSGGDCERCLLLRDAPSLPKYCNRGCADVAGCLCTQAGAQACLDPAWAGTLPASKPACTQPAAQGIQVPYSPRHMAQCLIPDPPTPFPTCSSPPCQRTAQHPPEQTSSAPG